MKKLLIATVVVVGLSSGYAMAQSAQGRDMRTARSFSAVTEGTFGAASRNTVLQDHLAGINRAKQCTVQARRMLSKLAKEDFRGAQRAFSPTVRDLVTTDRLAQMWASLESSYGEPSEPAAEGVLIDSPSGGYSVIALKMAYPKADLTGHVMCDIHNKLTDFKVTKDAQIATK